MSLLRNDKYEIKCTEGDASKVEIHITIGSEKLKDDELNNLLTTVRRILYAFDRSESVSSRYGSIDGDRKGK